MLKRKRTESESTGDTTDAPSDPVTAKQRKLLPPKLEQGKKALSKALKIARGFERQKMSRRRKTAEQEGKEEGVERVDKEIEALKKLEYHAVAETHLYKTLLKIKSIASHPALPPWVTVPQRPSPDTATMNVQARLFNANPTKVAMNQILGDVKAVLGLDDVPGPKIKKAKAGKEDAWDGRQSKTNDKSAAALPGQELDSEEEEESGEQEDSEEEFAGFDDRIVGSSGEESADEDIIRAPYNPTRDLSITPSVSSPSLSASPEPRKPGLSKPLANTTKSTFLPSLTAVGYVSGSESEAEDLGDEVAPPPKNRRGQRARQQLWEKKFGASAKHLQREKEKQKKDRNAGWDPRKGATDGSGKGRFGKGGNGRMGSGGGSGAGGRSVKGTDANAVEVAKKKTHRDDVGKLHPSWEAAKKAKEKAAVNVQFQGKKIVFD